MPHFGDNIKFICLCGEIKEDDSKNKNPSDLPTLSKL